MGPCPPAPAGDGGSSSSSSWKRKRPRRLHGSRPRAGRAMLSQRMSPDGPEEITLSGQGPYHIPPGDQSESPRQQKCVGRCGEGWFPPIRESHFHVNTGCSLPSPLGRSLLRPILPSGLFLHTAPLCLSHLTHRHPSGFLPFAFVPPIAQSPNHCPPPDRGLPGSSAPQTFRSVDTLTFMLTPALC